LKLRVQQLLEKSGARAFAPFVVEERAYSRCSATRKAQRTACATHNAHSPKSKRRDTPSGWGGSSARERRAGQLRPLHLAPKQKYRNKDKPSQTWSGRGKKPA
jgi:DNA-binding protein H-NS